MMLSEIAEIREDKIHLYALLRSAESHLGQSGWDIGPRPGECPESTLLLIAISKLAIIGACGLKFSKEQGTILQLFMLAFKDCDMAT